MSHHSHLVIAGHSFLSVRDGYIPEAAALFTEGERRLVRDAEGLIVEYGYYSTARVLRDRLQVQGFTTARALSDLDRSLAAWDGSEVAQTLWEGPPPAAEQVLDIARRRLSVHFDTLDSLSVDEVYTGPDLLYPLTWFMSPRALVRLLLDCAPDAPDEPVSLNLQELVGCCVEMDPDVPRAAAAREEQLADADTRLLILTEGVTDARLLAAGMEVTHPHLAGFVRFLDFDRGSAEGGVGALAKAAMLFVSAGVANRFVVLADNDTAAYAGLAKLKTQLPPECGVVAHYPSLPFLTSYYPTLLPFEEKPVTMNVNERAGSLEMYLGQDVLTGADGQLMPVQWGPTDPKVGRRQGALRPADKNAAQERFMAKVDAARAGQGTGTEDWSGIQAIIDAIVQAVG